MKKNKSTTRLINKILFVCLVINTLPVSFPAHAKTLTPHERATMRVEVNRDIKQVKKTVDGLKIAKNITTGLILGAGATITVAIAVLTGIVVLVLRKKLKVSFKNKLEKLKQKIIETKKSIANDIENIENVNKNLSDFTAIEIYSAGGPLSAFLKNVDTILSDLETGINIKTLFPKNLVDQFNEEYRNYLQDKYKALPISKVLKRLNTFIKTEISDKIKSLEKNMENKTLSLKTKIASTENAKTHLPIIMAAATVIASIFMLLFGFAGTVATTILARLPFSKNSISKSIDLVRKLELLEERFPGILTSKQKLVLAQFKKVAGDLTIQAILQNLDLRTKLITLINELIQKDQVLTKKLGGPESAQKELEKYFTQRLRKSLLQRNLEKADAKLKALGIKFVASFTKRKVAKMEKKYPLLKAATKDAVQEYIKEANKILEKFNDLLADAIVEGKITPETTVQPEPIIPL